MGGGGGSLPIFIGHGYHREDINEKPEMLQRLWLTCSMDAEWMQNGCSMNPTRNENEGRRKILPLHSCVLPCLGLLG